MGQATGNDLIEVECDLQADDIVAMHRFFLNEVTDGHKRRRNYVFVAGFAVVVAIGVAMSSLEWRYGNWEKNFLIPVIFAPPLLLAFGGLAAYLIYRESHAGLRRQMKKELSRPDSFLRLGRKRIRFCPKGYRVFSLGSEDYREWQIVPAVLRDFDDLFLCEQLSKTRMTAVIVPSRSLGSQAAFDDLCEHVTRLWRAAQCDAPCTE